MCIAKELSSNLVDTVNLIRKTSSELNTRLSNADKLICDIQHEIEFSNLDAYRGWREFKRLQDVLQERRKIKNEWQLIQPLIKYTGNIEKNIDNVHNTIVEMETKFEHRTYKPRIKNEINS